MNKQIRALSYKQEYVPSSQQPAERSGSQYSLAAEQYVRVREVQATHVWISRLTLERVPEVGSKDLTRNHGDQICLSTVQLPAKTSANGKKACFFLNSVF